MLTKDVLKSLRKAKGFSNMKEFCEAVDISFNTYQNYETGKRIPTADILIKLADFYGVSTDYLLGREEIPNPLAMLNLKPIKKKKFIEIFQELPEVQQAAVVDAMAKLSQAQENEKRMAMKTGDLISDEQAQETDAG